MRRTYPAPSSMQRGVTLVELMVALLLGLVLTGGFIQVFMANRVTYQFTEGLSRLQENGRFALDTLNFRARMAGYFGCLSEIQINNNLTNAGDLAFDFATGLTGFEANDTDVGDSISAGSSNPANSTVLGNWSPSLPADLSGLVVPGSDVLVIRNISARSHALRSPFTDGDEVFVTASPAEYAAGDIAIVSDCQKASVFQITAVTDQTTGTVGQVDLAHAASGVTPGNATAAWDTDQTYSAGAEVMRGETFVYFVGAPAAGEPPGLIQGRLRVNGTVAGLVFEELVESVETMQVLYGIDTDGDNDVDEYEPADAGFDWARVVAIRVGLLMRAPEEYGPEVDTAQYVVNGTTFNPFDDRRVRQVFTTTVALRNRLP